HVVKMCQGMARLGHEVVLLVPRRPEVREDVPDVFAFYGVDPYFEIRRVSWPPAAGPLTPLNAAAMGWAARRIRPDLVYGRFAEATAVSAEFGLPVVFETHLPLRITGAAG